MPEKNKCYETEITGITSEGSGVCRIDGMAVFVPMTAVGDVLSVKIVKVLKSYAFGIIDKILTPSPDRIISDECPVYRQCGGCVFRHISYEAECRIKAGIVEDAFRRLGGLSPEFDEFIAADSDSRYRNKAQYPLAMHNGKAVCGFYAPRSHRVIPVDDCPLQPVVFSKIVSCSLDFINDKCLSIYDEQAHSGDLRHIYIRCGKHSGQIMVCFVVRRDISKQLTALAELLHKYFPEIKSIVMNINPDNTNVILGDKWSVLYGSFTISDIMCSNSVQISPPSFYQVNTIQAERLYRRALEYAAPTGSEIIADLYCGAGTIGLSMARHVASVIGVEIVPEAIENAKKNARDNCIYNAEFYCGDAGKVFSKLRTQECSPDIIILDPPRKGCSEETLSIVCNAAPSRIVMISCNPSTAARDTKWLSDHGYSPVKVSGADLFPRTRHVECVVLMSRNET